MASDAIWILSANRMMAQALEVSRWMDTFAENGIRLEHYMASELRIISSSHGITITDAAGTALKAPRLCICRVYERHLPAALELMGTECLVSSRMVDLCYDKALVAPMIAAAGVPMVQSVVVPELTSEVVGALSTDIATGTATYPVVLKPARGRGGHGVELAHNEGELLYHADRLIGQPALVQPLVDQGLDLRVYVIGGEPRYAMERVGAPGEFRSNYSLGGTARRAELTEELRDLTQRVLAALPDSLPFGSVDFCYDQGKPVFCEVNANLGCHIPYEYAQIDLIGDYAQWIRTRYL